MQIVFFGDLHLYRLAVAPWDLLSKRWLGMVNLWLNRRSRFDRSLLAPTVARMAELGAELLLSCGDLTTVATAAEFGDARAGLGPLIERVETLIVPGNHDRYTFTASRRRRFEHFFAGHCAEEYPCCRALDEGLYLVALNPCRANWLTDRGDVTAQLPRLEQWLGGLKQTDRLIVLCHYTLGRDGTPPPIERESRRHTMRGDRRLLELLRGCGLPTLYLHGHVHRPWCYRPTTADNVVTVNAGAPLLRDGDDPGGQGFWQIETAGGWSLVRHVMDRAGRWHEQAVAIPDEPGRSADCRVVG